MHILNNYQIKSIVEIALESGKIAMSHFRSKNLKIGHKSDNSPITIADSLVSELIGGYLKKNFPKIPVICEEGENRDFGDGIFWLIDPIDGTRSFAAGNPEFTVNIALIENKKPIFGLIFAPAIENSPFYYTDENQNLIKYCVKNKISKKFEFAAQNNEDLIVVASKRSPDGEIVDWMKSNSYPDPKKILKVSSSLKFIYLIEEKANFYLHLRRSMEWDIAAGQALILALGGKVLNLDKSDFLYQKTDLANPPFFIHFNI
ncbi:MAG: 3'(2'), 5'-bisphosphate nucleotidase [Rickettsiales bacterium]